MPDLVQALEGMFDGGDMTIFQATISAVGQGVLTLEVNGGTFTDVPYMSAGFSDGISIIPPSIGMTCYVIGRKDWGLLVIGSPAPGPDRSTGGSVTLLWDPYTRATYNVATHAWRVPTDDQLVLQTSASTGLPSVNGALFFRLQDQPGRPTYMAPTTFGVLLTVPFVDTMGMSSTDTAYVTVNLITNAGPAGVPAFVMDGMGFPESTTLRLQTGQVAFFTLPLTWAMKMINDQAHGLYFSTQDYPPVIAGSGTVRTIANILPAP